jgi:hypothetical protein
VLDLPMPSVCELDRMCRCRLASALDVTFITCHPADPWHPLTFVYLNFGPLPLVGWRAFFIDGTMLAGVR